MITADEARSELLRSNPLKEMKETLLLSVRRTIISGERSFTEAFSTKDVTSTEFLNIVEYMAKQGYQVSSYSDDNNHSITVSF